MLLFLLPILLLTADTAPASLAASDIERFEAEEARQGVVADRRHVYAISF